jgi:antitoxin component YwqK of YwqJK toxin-antitoxin module
VSAQGTDCELNGKPVNLSNGSSTAGETGLIRCRHRDTGVIQREEELRDGKLMGQARYFRDGVLESEFQLNAAGNKEGAFRKYAATRGNNTLLEEAQYRNGLTVGQRLLFAPDGSLRDVIAYDDAGHEVAVAKLNAQGQLRTLRCAQLPVLEPRVHDRVLCGHDNTASEVSLFDAKGRLAERVSYQRGKLLRATEFREDGSKRAEEEHTADGSVERSFAKNGVKVEELQYVGSGLKRIKTLELQYYESGKPKSELRYRDRELQLERHWYMNGQPQTRREQMELAGHPGMRESHYHDNGQLASDGFMAHEPGDWGPTSRPIGLHKSFYESGRPQSESTYDAQGNLTRERAWDEQGKQIRDDAVFEDGSRRAYQKP